jgi:site-specific recombinase XerD
MVRLIGQYLPKKEAIPYERIKQIVLGCGNQRTQALLAFQYGLGTRAGELAMDYLHSYKKFRSKSNKVIQKVTTIGVKRSDVLLSNEIIYISRPNFKQKRRSKLDDITKHKSFILIKQEKWLADIILAWLNSSKEDYIFNIRRSRICFLIDKELKQYDSRFSSHWLRHSRATHIGELTEDPMAVKELLGHARIDTSMKYVHYSTAMIKKKLGEKSFDEVLGKVLE